MEKLINGQAGTNVQKVYAMPHPTLSIMTENDSANDDSIGLSFQDYMRTYAQPWLDKNVLVDLAKEAMRSTADGSYLVGTGVYCRVKADLEGIIHDEFHPWGPRDGGHAKINFTKDTLAYLYNAPVDVRETVLNAAATGAYAGLVAAMNPKEDEERMHANDYLQREIRLALDAAPSLKTVFAPNQLDHLARYFRTSYDVRFVARYAETTKAFRPSVDSTEQHQ